MNKPLAQAIKNPRGTGTLAGDQAAVRAVQAEVVQDPAVVEKKIKVSVIVRQRMGLVGQEKARIWHPYNTLQTLMEVMSDSRGLFSGEISELAGEPSGGKSTVATLVQAECQKQDGIAHWIDFENSRDDRWYTRLGADYEAINFYYPEAIRKGKKAAKKAAKPIAAKKTAGKGTPDLKSAPSPERILAPDFFDGIEIPQAESYRIIGAEEVCAQAEAGVLMAHQLYPKSHQIIVLDSVAAVIADKEAAAGVENQNMATGMALTRFMGQLLRRWIAIFPSVNTSLILINQVRTKPNVMFGDPAYTPGGRAMEFYPHSRVRVKSLGKMITAGEYVGNKGMMRCYKNKAGGTNHATTGFKLFLKQGIVRFCPLSDVLTEKA